MQVYIIGNQLIKSRSAMRHKVTIVPFISISITPQWCKKSVQIVELYRQFSHFYEAGQLFSEGVLYQVSSFFKTENRLGKNGCKNQWTSGRHGKLMHWLFYYYYIDSNISVHWLKKESTSSTPYLHFASPDLSLGTQSIRLESKRLEERSASWLRINRVYRQK